MANSERKAKRQQTLSVDLGGKLLGQVEDMRREIQDSLETTIAVSRGDVVRLALRRLYLAILAHRAEVSGECIPHHVDWMETAQQIQVDARCPDWLVPGKPDTPSKKTSKPKKEKPR